MSLKSFFKPGDYALISGSHFDVNLGKVVKLLRLQQPEDLPQTAAPADIHVWLVQCDQFLYLGTADNEFYWALNQTTYPEFCLTPIDEGQQSWL